MGKVGKRRPASMPVVRQIWVFNLANVIEKLIPVIVYVRLCNLFVHHFLLLYISRILTRNRKIMKIAWLGFSSLLILFTLYSYRNDVKVKQKFIETDYMDSSVKPGDNFFLFVNGKWIKNTTIPPTESGVGSFLDVYNGTKGHLRSILDSVSKFPQAKGSLEQKVGDFYASGMDSSTIEKRGYEPLKPYFQQINALTD